MSKKSFAGGFNTLLGETTTPSAAASKHAARTAGMEPADTRITLVLPVELVEKLRAAAYWQHMLIREAMEEAITDYIKKHKPKPRPEKARKQEVEARKRRVEALSRKYNKPANTPALPKY